MKSRIQLALIIAVSVFVGAGFAQVFMHTHAAAQQGPRQWHECFSASLWSHDGAAMANPQFRPHTVPVPAGWVPVGGAGNDNAYSVVLCR